MSWPEFDADHLIVSSSQMRGLEEKLFSYGMPEEALMEKVGLKMKSWFMENRKFLTKGVLVLIGPGHNGGDGLVLARELHLAGVEVSLWCPLEIKKPLTAKHHSYCISIGITQLQSEPDASDKALWIEALFGLSQTRPIPQEIGRLLKTREELRPGNLISLDVPAGICSENGRIFETGAAKAAFTLTVGLIKAGLIQDRALHNVGTLLRLDIGIPEVLLDSFPNKTPLKISSNDIETFNLPEIAPNSSKYQRGRLFVIAGSKKYKGASLLALQGAIASGVGSIQTVLPPDIANSLFGILPEVIFHNYSYSQDEDIYLEKCLKKINLTRIDSLLIGPGLGLANENWDQFALALEEFTGLLVLDADGLNRLSSSNEGWKWLRKRKGFTWITPHIDEFSRLFPEIDPSCPLKAAALAAEASGVGVLIKGAHSVIASPTGSVWQLVNTSSVVARTGLGDLLAGFIAGIGAQGICSKNKLKYDLFALAVLIHAHAAKKCEEGSNASLIAKKLGKVLKNLQHQ